jgi:hypothetical protein
MAKPVCTCKPSAKPPLNVGLVSTQPLYYFKHCYLNTLSAIYKRHGSARCKPDPVILKSKLLRNLMDQRF